METILVIVGVASVLALLRSLFSPKHEPQYIFVPVPIEHQRQHIGCLPIVMVIVFSLLIVALVSGSY